MRVPRRFREVIRYHCPISKTPVQIRRVIVDVIETDGTVRHETERFDCSKRTACPLVGNRSAEDPRECDWHYCAYHRAVGPWKPIATKDTR